jgi:hypothetical protein
MGLLLATITWFDCIGLTFLYDSQTMPFVRVLIQTLQESLCNHIQRQHSMNHHCASKIRVEETSMWLRFDIEGMEIRAMATGEFHENVRRCVAGSTAQKDGKRRFRVVRVEYENSEGATEKMFCVKNETDPDKPCLIYIEPRDLVNIMCVFASNMSLARTRKPRTVAVDGFENGNERVVISYGFSASAAPTESYEISAKRTGFEVGKPEDEESITLLSKQLVALACTIFKQIDDTIEDFKDAWEAEGRIKRQILESIDGDETKKQKHLNKRNEDASYREKVLNSLGFTVNS